MTEKEIKLFLGALLHDIGKVNRNQTIGRPHSQGGGDFLKEIGIADKDVLEPILYHHSSALKEASIEQDSLAYVIYMANKIATGVDRRREEGNDQKFEELYPLQPVFNILNGNQEKKYYHPMMLSDEINFPTDERQAFPNSFYDDLTGILQNSLKNFEWTGNRIQKLMDVLEKGLTYVPASQDEKVTSDISLYDHSKMTAALAGCIYQYLKSGDESNFKDVLYDKADNFFDRKAFLLVSIDISGIQSFIYTIHSQDALKMLRARSFYLEILMEHLIDTLLERVSLLRTNLIYSGGGHAYLLLPNTELAISAIEQLREECNQWFLKEYDIALYAAIAWVPASANSLKNIPDGSYADLFASVSSKISGQKLRRYSEKDIIALNNQTHILYDRECKVCKRLESVNDEGLCEICNGLKTSSKNILYAPFFVVIGNKAEASLPLPGGKYLVAETMEQLQERLKYAKEAIVHIYSKNKSYPEIDLSTKIWVGNYTKGQSFEELANVSRGIKRIGVLRADVDNLGQTFVGGFKGENNTLSRTAALSRQLSLFFKFYINDLMNSRNITIVYSGGDDVFLVGAWNEVMEFGLVLSETFDRFTQGTLSISAGEGIYSGSYPIHQIAIEVGELEEESKSNPGKNSFTVLPDGEAHRVDGSEDVVLSDGTYSWKEFKDKVLEEKLKLIKDFFDNDNERGNAYLYHLLELIRGQNEKINFARYVYLLSRMEPKGDVTKEQIERYRVFSKKMYEWMKQPKDCRELKTAITIYVYMTREKEELEDDN